MDDHGSKEGARIFLDAITKVQSEKGVRMGKTMAEPLARRNFEAEYDDLRWDELTDSVKQGWVIDAQAIIDFLVCCGVWVGGRRQSRSLHRTSGGGMAASCSRSPTPRRHKRRPHGSPRLDSAMG